MGPHSVPVLIQQQLTAAASQASSHSLSTGMDPMNIFAPQCHSPSSPPITNFWWEEAGFAGWVNAC